jgi:predicted RNase H-like nuclease (RuvC/YqgF family)
MQAGLQSREANHRDGFIHDLKAKVGDEAMQIELLEKKIEKLEDGLRPPPRRPSL